MYSRVRRSLSIMLLLRVSQTKWWWRDFDVGFYRADDSSEWYARHVGRLTCRNGTRGMRVRDSPQWHAMYADRLSVRMARMACGCVTHRNGTQSMRARDSSEWHARHAGAWLTAMASMVCVECGCTVQSPMWVRVTQRNGMSYIMQTTRCWLTGRVRLPGARDGRFRVWRTGGVLGEVGGALGDLYDE